MDPWLKFFIVVTAAAVVLQLAVLTVLAVSLRRTAAKVERLTEEVHKRALPLMDTTQAILDQSRGKLDVIASNLAHTTSVLRNQVERLDATVTDVVDRTRLQVIRADDMVSRTLDRVEETSEYVQHTVISPVRQAAALMQGVSAGLAAFFGLRRPRERERSGVTQDEELFI